MADSGDKACTLDERHSRLRRGAQPGRLWAWLAFGVVLILVAASYVGEVAGQLPYTQHPDERQLTGRAIKMLASGDPNPHFFNYPTLPIYMTLAAMRVGAGLGNVSEPVAKWYVQPPGAPNGPLAAYATARFCFAALALTALALTALLAGRAFDSPTLLPATALILGASTTFRTSAVVYLNVDIVATTWVVTGIFCTLHWWERHDILRRVVVPGVCVGLAAASKYTCGLLLLPCLLSLWLAPARPRWWWFAVLAASAVLAFVVCVPYSVLDTATFLADVEFEMHHYEKGHRGFQAEPGWPQLRYYLGELWRDLGALGSVAVVLGLIYGGLRFPRQTIVIASLPVALLLFMTTKRVHFLRTVLPVFALCSVFQAAALCAATRGLMTMVRRWLGGGLQSAVALSTMLVLTVAVLPRRGWLRVWDAPSDPRNQALRFLEHQARGSRILVAPELYFPAERLTRLGAQEGELALRNFAPAVPTQTTFAVVAGSSRPARRHRRRRPSQPETDRFAELGGEVVFQADGQAVAAPRSKDRLPAPTPNPAIAIYRFASPERP
jgi:hypothetical protein